jgi:cytochrome c oxidase subunit IV
MTTTTEHTEQSDHTGHAGHPAGEHGESNRKYVMIAAILAAITGLEVALSYAHVGKFFMPALLILMVLKFWTVVSYFMHLKHDNTMFKLLFYSGLFLAVLVYLAALLTFRFFDGG